MIAGARGATQGRLRSLGASGLLLALVVVWGLRHIEAASFVAQGHQRSYEAVYFFAFLVLAWQLGTAHVGLKPWRTTNRQRTQLNQLHVVANVPVYNEDPDALRACLEALFEQTRRPQVISVVNDGSTKANYVEVRKWAARMAKLMGVELQWFEQDNAGKRHAQARTFRANPDADVFLTLDSDTMLDKHAIDEGLKPFKYADVMSVAGIMLAANVERNFITRGTDLILVMWQSLVRAGLSATGSVLVNSGPIAFYRGQVIHDKIDAYVGETFFGRPVAFSDDAMLTTFALIHGRTVQQPSAFAFVLMPDNYSHHLRQYVRWMRGATVRSFWRFKYLPMDGYAFWANLLAWFQIVIEMGLFVALFVVQPFIDPSMLPYYLIVPALIGYAQGLRYLSITRTDVNIKSQLLTFAVSPLVCLYAFFALRAIRWYGMATCLNTGEWGTREDIEVRLFDTQPDTAVLGDLAVTTTY